MENLGTSTESGQYPHKLDSKPYTQSISMVLGPVMIVIGLSGALDSQFMGLHLSFMHVLVLLSTGALALWGSTREWKRVSFRIDLGLGIFYIIHAIVGFSLGRPGVPGVGYDAPDGLLIKIAPGFLELGTLDHILHGLLGVLFLTGAFSWYRHLGHERTSNREIILEMENQ
jgi:hypothetical protein